jgi:hypothetical protein
MMPDYERPDLAEVVRRKITAGVLPADVPTKAWVGHGTDATCTICDLLIGPDDLECEVDLPDARTVRLWRGPLPLRDPQSVAAQIR